MTNSASALLVFAKAPQPDAVKTRLAGFITAEEASAVYAAFLDDAAAQFSELECDVRYYVAPLVSKGQSLLESKGQSLQELPVESAHRSAQKSAARALPMPPDAVLLGQVGDDLGARMLGAFSDSFAAGYRHVVIVGTDHPTLPTAYVTRAFDQLSASSRIVIGPSDDGGYYLLGMNRLYPVLFEGMTYSHPDVFSRTMERAAAVAADVTVLPRWFDVDTPESLIRLWREVGEFPDRAPATHVVLSRLAERYGWS